MKDFLRPRTEPARSIYDSFQKAAVMRNRRTYEQSVLEERKAVLREATKQAKILGMRTPKMYEVINADLSAMGHSDYGAKWAIGVADMMRQPRE